MDEYTFNNYPGMEYGNAPVDVEATLNSLLASSPAEPYDFSASLLSSSLQHSPATLRNSTSSSNVNLVNALPLRTYTPNNIPNNINNNVNIPGNVNNINNINLNNSGIPLLPPPPAAPLHHSFSDIASHPGTPSTNTTAQLDKRKRRRKDDIYSLPPPYFVTLVSFSNSSVFQSFSFFSFSRIHPIPLFITLPFCPPLYFPHCILISRRLLSYFPLYVLNSLPLSFSLLSSSTLSLSKIDDLKIFYRTRCVRGSIGRFINLLRLIMLFMML